ncbi:LTA synthase family protein [Pedobacter puniceum]|uniref:Sulfatase-like hydrolase/transferase n=1 Tax=Pedobacter puniceum TaxID=2666136 RepID=A0A7K0FJZ4_9SPHI|nr:LTA synthase family protein [Pedobacter puniceum]MRX46112.1 sulfatase-like hydrolase/transferase [Pedobacter puniceum]
MMIKDPYNFDEENLLVKKTKRAILQFAHVSLAFFILILLLRLVEVGVMVKSYQSPENWFQVSIYAFLLDFLLFLKISFFLFIIYLVAVQMVVGDRRTQTYIYAGVTSFTVVVALLLTKYFYTTLLPLGDDIYGYSFSEISQTALAGASVDVFSILFFLTLLGLLWILVIYFSKLVFIPFKAAVGFILASFLAILSGISFLPESKRFKSEFDYNLAVNKTGFFFQKSYDYFTRNEPEVDIYAENYIEDAVQGSNLEGINSFKYVDAKYPFLRENDAKDVLGNFFDKFDGPPNIIYIQVEGLGRAFSGEGAYLGSFTPFLDSLAQKSLYFENFLAAQGRTFASLPSVLGSLPFAEHGFADLGNKMPHHLNLINILKANNYHTRFLSGFDLAFDNEGLYLQKSNIDETVSISNFGSGYKQMPSNSGGFTWGYGDMDLMLKSALYLNKVPSKPGLTIIQTVSMHTPYQVLNQPQYVEKFEKQLNALRLSDDKKEDYRKYKSIYSTILYSDDAVRAFINNYSKNPAYNNTIFIISGDHRLPEIPIATKIDRYHVPLLIYSPKLKRTARIKSISSHLDITPSILAFLNVNYNLKVPKLVNFIGSGLDTVRSFRSVHKYPLMQTKNELNDFVYGKFFLNQNTLYAIDDRMGLEPVENEQKKIQLLNELKQYKTINNNVSKGNKLLPDSLYLKFSKF